MLSALAAFAAFSTLAGMAAAVPPDSQRYQFKGENASASFQSVDASGCVMTDVSIWGGESVSREGPGAPTQREEVFVYVSRVDQCNGWNVLFSGSGSTSTAELDIDRTQGATLVATIPIYDEISGTTTDVSLNLTWAGTGDVFRGHYHGHDRFPGGSFRYRSSGSYRDAQVSGEVRLGIDPRTNLAGSATYAQLSTSNSGSMQITR